MVFDRWVSFVKYIEAKHKRVCHQGGYPRLVSEECPEDFFMLWCGSLLAMAANRVLTAQLQDWVRLD